MNNTRFWPVLLSAVVILWLVGCNSKSPLSDPREAALDESVFGLWRTPCNDQYLFLHIDKRVVSEDQVWMEFVTVLPDGKGDVESHRWIGFPTTLGGQHYANIAHQDHGTFRSTQIGESLPTEKLLALIDGYYLVKYQVTGKFLDLYLADSDFLKEAIAAGQLKGSELLLKEASEKLAAFFLANDKKLFSESRRVRFRRVN